MENSIRLHYRLLSHQNFGVTELRTFNGIPKVAYCDNKKDFIRLCKEVDGKKDVYVGVQPRPLKFFDYASNKWRTARPGPDSNCATDEDIEFVANLFFDCDVKTDERGKNPARDKELEQTLKTVLSLCHKEQFKEVSTVCESGNGHYLLVNIKPFAAEHDTGLKLKMFEKNIINSIGNRYPGAKLDSMANLSRVMRVIGTRNLKGEPSRERPHRISRFVTPPVFLRSEQLKHIIGEVKAPEIKHNSLPIAKEIPADLKQISKCLFMQWCIQHPGEVSEPAWFDMITNLVHLKGGPGLIHTISGRDSARYNWKQTQKRIERYLQLGYKPRRCENLSGVNNRNGGSYFECPNLGKCNVAAPMYLAVNKKLSGMQG